MAVEVWNKFLVLFSVVSENTVNCISPFEILLYLVSDSPLFDAIATWYIWCFFPKMAFHFVAYHDTTPGQTEITLAILNIPYHVWDVFHHVPWRRNTNLGIIRNVLAKFFIALWEHSHVMAVNVCGQDEWGPFSYCRREDSWGRLSTATLWDFQGGMNGVVVLPNHLEAIGAG